MNAQIESLLRDFNDVLNYSQSIEDVADDKSLDAETKVGQMLALGQQIQLVASRVLPG